MSSNRSIKDRQEKYDWHLNLTFQDDCVGQVLNPCDAFYLASSLPQFSLSLSDFVNLVVKGVKLVWSGRLCARSEYRTWLHFELTAPNTLSQKPEYVKSTDTFICEALVLAWLGCCVNRQELSKILPGVQTSKRMWSTQGKSVSLFVWQFDQSTRERLPMK